MTSNVGHATWRRGREVLDDYDRGGVFSEELADDLVNELACLRPRPRRAVVTGWGTALVGKAPPARPRLRLLRGGLVD